MNRIALGPTDLVLCPLTLRRRLFECTVEQYRSFLDAGVAAGYRGASLALIDAGIAAGEGLSRAELLGLFESRGLATPIIEAITVWSQGPTNTEIDEHVAPALDLAVAAGAETIVAICMEPTVPSLEVAARGFARACAAAAERDLRVSVEFFPWGAISDLATAWALIAAAGAPNGGIVFDTWHFARRPAGLDFSTIERIPGERIHVLQLSDTAPDASDDLMHETLRSRRLPGDGTAQVVEVLRALRRIGAEPLLAPEVFSHELVDLGPFEMTRRVAEATRAVLAAAGWR